MNTKRTKNRCFEGCLFFVIVIIVLCGTAIIIEPVNRFLGNGLSLLHRNGYVIPSESSVFTFVETKRSEGSGEYWLYGEDENFFYSQMMSSKEASYIKISKEEASSKQMFDQFNFKTWNNAFLCGDLLEIYAEKPNKLEFIKCEAVNGSQKQVLATYRVRGENAKEVEAFLVEKYGIGELKWACCGWDTAGRYGGFKHSELTKMHPYLYPAIVMFASGEVEDENGEMRLEFDLTKIKYFTVEVDLSIV